MTEGRPPVALVVGGSRGIGAAVCRRLGADGHLVHLSYRRDLKAARAVLADLPDGSAIHRCDVSDPLTVELLVDAVLDAHERIDVLVTTAAVTDDELALLVTPRQWQTVIDVNLSGTFHVARTVLGPMLDRRSGAIVTVSSSSVLRPGPGQSAYAASKGGVEALTRALAAEVGHTGIRVNGVRPGPIRTDMSAPVAARFDVDDAEWGEPDDVADVVAFLASDDARHVQGQIIGVDGGTTTRRRVARR